MNQSEHSSRHNRTAFKRLVLCTLLTHLCFPFAAVKALAQIQIGTVRVTVTDPSAAVVGGAAVTLLNKLTGYTQYASTDDRGAANFNNVPFDDYQLDVRVPQFQPATRRINVRSNLPVDIEIKLAIPGSRESVNVEAEPGLIERDSSSSELDLNESSIRRSPGTVRSVQQLMATLPGWSTENNGLMHIRGVDDGVLFILDGVPVADRLDATMAGGLDTEMISSMNVLVGNLPAEFGGKSGAVVTIQPRSGIAKPISGTLQLSGGSFNARELSVSVAGGGKNSGFFVASSATRSNRYLDPVDPGNFHNRGGAARLNLRTDWHPTPDDILIFNLSVNGSDIEVPNRLAQELAGQHQRQELRDNSETISWQRSWSPSTVSNIAIFHRFHEARLLGSAFDTPLFAAQARRHARLGWLASVTHTYREHTFKAGVEATRVTPNEFFTFAITDPLAAAEEGISEEALVFDKQDRLCSRIAKREARPRGIFRINSHRSRI
jgi:carboxypeptidase family protein/TonB-dependent receptor-like protein